MGFLSWLGIYAIEVSGLGCSVLNIIVKDWFLLICFLLIFKNIVGLKNAIATSFHYGLFAISPPLRILRVFFNQSTTMKRTLLLLFCSFLLSMTMDAQIPNGSIAPNFKAEDINGVEYELYDILAEGKDVIIDFSATWCGPCWAFHNTKTLDDLHHDVGPDGTDDAVVLFVESDVTTTLADLQGTGTNTTGDWITGTSYPILDNSGIASAYQIGSYPTILRICADRKVFNIGRISVDQYKENMSNCPSVEYASEPYYSADKYIGCGDMTVQFLDDSWPRPDTWLWNFGDGETSTEQFPVHTYTEIGDYDVTLEVSNEYGSNNETREGYMQLGEGVDYDNIKGGPVSSDIGTGRYFEGGHQALIFDVYEPMMISTVKVFSDKEQERTVVLLDGNGNLISSKIVNVPVGEHRIELEFFVDEGTDYRLGLRSDAFMFRNDGGTQYPYDIGGLMSITESTASTAPLQYYYYFYDWEVRKAGCTPALSTDDVTTTSFTLYPNPASSVVTIEQEDIQVGQVRLTDLLGSDISVLKKQQVDQVLIDVSDLQKGVYLINVGDQAQKFYKL